MNSKELLTKKFDKSFNGYKIDEVDEFIADVAKQMSKLEKDNKELEKKLEVLADKIREYRDDEEAIKEALLGAQKERTRMISEAKEQAVKAIEQANEEAARILKAAEDDIVEKTALSKKIIAEAEQERERILRKAKDEAEDLQLQMQLQREKDEKILALTHAESETFRNNLLSLYEDHIRCIKSFSERCETEFVVKTRKIFEEREAKRLEEENLLKEQEESIEPEFSQPSELTQPVVEESVIQQELQITTEEAIQEPVIIPYETFEDATTEILFTPVFEEGAKEEEAIDDSVEDGPFFIKRNRKHSHENLQFGNNNR